MRVVRKLSDLAYVKLWTSGLWIVIKQELVSPPRYEYDKAFLVTADDSLGIGGSIRAR